MKQLSFVAGKATKTGTMTSSQRHLSSQGIVAVEKLRDALEEYRKEQ
jgi:hypothetical protein